jgi:hypothetical protein
MKLGDPSRPPGFSFRPPKVCDVLSLPPRRHRRVGYLSWDWMRFRVLYETTYRAYWVTRSRPGVIVSDLALAVFQPSPSAEYFRIRLILSCASPSLQSLRINAGPALLSGHLPWASVPHRGTNKRSPHSRASQARFVPSTTFLTSSTAYSSACLCGFISPRNHVQGSLFRVFPSRKAARARRSPLPSCR